MPPAKTAQHRDANNNQSQEERLAKLCNRLEKLQTSQDVINHAVCAGLLMDIGTAHRELNRLHDAMHSYLNGMDIFRKIFGDEHMIVAVCLSRVGDIHYLAGEPDDAMDAYLDALKIIRVLHNAGESDPIDVAGLLNKVGKISYERDDMEVAVSSFSQASNLCCCATADRNEVTRCSKQEHSNVEGDGGSITITSNDSSLNEIYAEALGWMGRINVDRAEYEQALHVFNEALRALRSVPGASTTSLQEQIANVHFRRGDLSVAMKTFESARRGKEKELGKDHPDVALTLVNIANIYEQRRDYQKAIDLLLRALKIQKEESTATDAESYINLAATLNNIANIHTRKGEFAFAMSAYTDALELKEKCVGRHPRARREVALTLVCIGNVHEQQEQFEDAMQLYEEARKIQEEVLGDNHVEYAATINNIGVVFGKLKRYEDAMECYIKVLCIYRGALGPEHPDVAFTLCNIAEIHRMWNDYSEALNAFSEAKRIQEISLGKESVALADTYQYIGVTYKEMGDQERAISMLRMSLDTYRAAGLDGQDDKIKSVLAKLSQIDYSFETQVQNAMSWAGLIGDAKCSNSDAFATFEALATSVFVPEFMQPCLPTISETVGEKSK